MESAAFGVAVKKPLGRSNGVSGVSEGTELIVSEFGRLVRFCADCTLERSVKIEDGIEHGNRYNLWYRGGQPADFVGRVEKFLSGIELGLGARLSWSHWKRLVSDNTNSGSTGAIVVGVDSREQRADCRIKLWLEIRENHRRVQDAIESCEDRNRIREVHYGNSILFGFDLFLDGRSRPKAYAEVRRSDLLIAEVARRLERAFPARVLQRIRETERVHVAFHDVGFRMLHFHHLHDAWAVLDQIGRPDLRDVHARFRGPHRDIVISIPEHHVAIGDTPRDVTLYYESEGIPVWPGS